MRESGRWTDSFLLGSATPKITYLAFRAGVVWRGVSRLQKRYRQPRLGHTRMVSVSRNLHREHRLYRSGDRSRGGSSGKDRSHRSHRSQKYFSSGFSTDLPRAPAKGGRWGRWDRSSPELRNRGGCFLEGDDLECEELTFGLNSALADDLDADLAQLTANAVQTVGQSVGSFRPLLRLTFGFTDFGIEFA
jgi:hypothetical protein